MHKILFNLNGKQKLVEVGQGGGVTSLAEVLWDERLHGLMPEIILGKMEAHDELEDRIELIQKVDKQGNIILNEQGQIVLEEKVVQVSVRKLRVLNEEIASHAAAKAAEEQRKINAEAKALLASTDWLIIREIDSGVACPAEIKAERAAARARIKE